LFSERDATFKKKMIGMEWYVIFYVENCCILIWRVVQLILLSNLFPFFGASTKFYYRNSYRIIVYITCQEYCISYHGSVDILCR